MIIQDIINCVHDIIDTELNKMQQKAPIDKNAITKLPLSLPNIKEVLIKAFNNFQPVHMKNIVVAIGNTGCGKSTLLSSMILGPESLS